MLTKSSAKLSIGSLSNRPTEIWRMRAENTKAKSIVGWSSTVSFENGLIRTIKWFKNFINLYFSESGLRRL